MKFTRTHWLCLVLVLLCFAGSSSAKPLFAGGIGFAPVVYDKPQGGKALYRTGPAIDLYAGHIASPSTDFGLRLNIAGYQLDSRNPGTRGFIGPSVQYSLDKSQNGAFLIGAAGSFFVHQAGNSHYRFGGGGLLAAGYHLTPTLTLSFGTSAGKIRGSTLAYAFAVMEWLKF